MQRGEADSDGGFNARIRTRPQPYHLFAAICKMNPLQVVAEECERLDRPGHQAAAPISWKASR